MLVIGPDRHQGLTNVDTGNKSLGFAKSTSHSSLEPEIIEKILWNQLFQNYMVLRVLCRVVHNLELTFYVKWAENFWNHHTPCLVYNQSVGVSEIFLRFYVKLVTLILEPKNCFFQHFSRSEYKLFGTFCHFQVKNVSKYWNSKLSKLLKWLFLTFRKRAESISGKIQVVGKVPQWVSTKIHRKKKKKNFLEAARDRTRVSRVHNAPEAYKMWS